jgi:hypothetical protein
MIFLGWTKLHVSLPSGHQMYNVTLNTVIAPEVFFKEKIDSLKNIIIIETSKQPWSRSKIKIV